MKHVHLFISIIKCAGEKLNTAKTPIFLFSVLDDSALE